ncbi:hypothetical protein [Bacillus marinisedimentorum]|uniref:hypothetical protein n=1 Tax=Bacillus marinisedimentorum TaxID=1821260 RepID=UPI001FDFAE1D|nr:hypothetical protein [Bacillus marinisedimentorum]
MFIWMYIIGLIIGLGVYGLTYLFSKEAKNSKRVLVVLVLGVLGLLGSILIIGGFEGMPFGVLALGIITISILMAFIGESSLWKLSISTFIVLFVLSYSAVMYFNQVDYWIVKKPHYDSAPDIRSYMNELQQNPSIKGYKTFTISEGNKGVVLSLGGQMAGNNIEVMDVTEHGNTTEIKVRTFYNKSPEQNPVVMIGLDRIQPEVVIMDTDGTIYEEAKVQ